MKNNKILKFLLPIVAVLLIFAVIGKKQGWFGKALMVKVAVENAEARTIVETITANGKIQPEKEVKISPDVSGEIVELTVKEGDHVDKGQLLLRIKPDTYISQRDRSVAAISSARARLAQAEAQFTQAELSFNRSKQLYEEQTVSKSEFEQAQASYTVAKSVLKPPLKRQTKCLPKHQYLLLCPVQFPCFWLNSENVLPELILWPEPNF
jgi:HlyD family secretion protein